MLRMETSPNLVFRYEHLEPLLFALLLKRNDSIDTLLSQQQPDFF